MKYIFLPEIYVICRDCMHRLPGCMVCITDRDIVQNFCFLKMEWLCNVCHKLYESSYVLGIAFFPMMAGKTLGEYRAMV